MRVKAGSAASQLSSASCRVLAAEAADAVRLRSLEIDRGRLVCPAARSGNGLRLVRANGWRGFGNRCARPLEFRGCSHTLTGPYNNRRNGRYLPHVGDRRSRGLPRNLLVRGLARLLLRMFLDRRCLGWWLAASYDLALYYLGRGSRNRASGCRYVCLPGGRHIRRDHRSRLHSCEIGRTNRGRTLTNRASACEC